MINAKASARATASSVTSTSSKDSNQELISKTDDDFKLVGFEASTSSKFSYFKLPEASLQNMLCMANFANGVAGDALEKTSPLENTTNLGILGVSSLITGILQSKEFYSRHQKIQALQIELIRALPTHAIIATQPSCKRTAKNFCDIEDIIQILTSTGSIEIEMEENIKFKLQHNSFWTLRAAGGAAISLVASVASAATYITNRINENMDPNNPNADFMLSTTDQAVLITTGLPILTMYEKITNILRRQEENIFEAIRLVINNLFIDKNNIDKIPTELLLVAEHFMSEDDKAANQRTINACKEYKNAKRIKDLKTQVSELRKAKQQVIIDVAPPMPAKISSASTQSSEKTAAPKAKCVIC
jgi:hypothetical protein